jgi:putrescine aminotransferase
MTTRNIETARAEAAWINRIVDGTTTLTDDLRREIATKTVDNFRHHVNKGFLEHRKSATIAGEFAMTEWSGKGSILTDTLGREFIDALGGFGLFSLGVAHPKVVAAVKAQLDRNPQYSQEMLDPLRAQLCRVIANLTPGNVQCGFIANSGTEGVEGAIKLAKLHTGRSGFISMTGGFHGKTAGSLSLLGKAMFRQPLLPLLPDIRFAEFGNLASVEAELRKAEMVGEGIAGIVAEPIQGEAGAIVPPDDFWPGLRRLCDRYGTLLIADEVQTGFGRTGTIFGVDHWNVAPDIMCFGKALGGGVVACSAFFATPEVWECMTPNPFMHTTTTGGNPIACAAALGGHRGDVRGRHPPVGPREGRSPHGHPARVQGQVPVGPQGRARKGAVDRALVRRRRRGLQGGGWPVPAPGADQRNPEQREGHPHRTGAEHAGPHPGRDDEPPGRRPEGVVAVNKNIQNLSSVWTHSTSLVAVSGQGVRLTTRDGRRMLDFTSGIGVNSTGHCHPRVVAAIQKQAATLVFSQINVLWNDRICWNWAGRCARSPLRGWTAIFFTGQRRRGGGVGGEARQARHRQAERGRDAGELPRAHAPGHGHDHEQDRLPPELRAVARRASTWLPIRTLSPWG